MTVGSLTSIVIPARDAAKSFLERLKACSPELLQGGRRWLLMTRRLMQRPQSSPAMRCGTRAFVALRSDGGGRSPATSAFACKRTAWSSTHE